MDKQDCTSFSGRQCEKLCLSPLSCKNSASQITKCWNNSPGLLAGGKVPSSSTSKARTKPWETLVISDSASCFCTCRGILSDISGDMIGPINLVEACLADSTVCRQHRQH